MWLSRLFVSLLPPPTVFCLFDLFLVHGIKILFSASLAILSMLQPVLLEARDESTLGNIYLSLLICLYMGVTDE
jgi:hypothetical protein